MQTAASTGKEAKQRSYGGADSRNRLGGQRSSPRKDGQVAESSDFGRIPRVLTGMRFDVKVAGRVESTGCVTSGRRWHRRIPSLFHRFGAIVFDMGLPPSL